jgi:hypothetical protein
MKISEITQQTSEAFGRATKPVRIATNALTKGFFKALEQAGVAKGTQTAEDLAEYLISARIDQDAIRKSLFTHFQKGFRNYDPDIHGDNPFLNDPDKLGGDSEEQPNVPGQPSVQDLPDGEEEQPNVPGQPEVPKEPPEPPEPPEPQQAQEPELGWDPKLQPKTMVQKIRGKIPRWGGGTKKPATIANPDSTVQLPPGVDPQTGQVPRSKNLKKTDPRKRRSLFRNSRDFSGKSLIVEAGTPIPNKLVRTVIQTAVQNQTRAGGLNKLQVPAGATSPSIPIQALFQKSEKETQSGDIDGSQAIATIAAQIKGLSDADRAILTSVLRTPDPKTAQPDGEDTPVFPEPPPPKQGEEGYDEWKAEQDAKGN